MKWAIALLLVLGGLFWLLHERVPSEEGVVGVYAGQHKGYIDNVELTRNHRFTQVLTTPRGEEMKSSGDWKLANKALELDGYIFFIDEQIEGSFENPIRTSVTFSAYHGMLIRDWDSGFYRLSLQ